MKLIKTLALVALAGSVSACAVLPSDAGRAFLANVGQTSGHATEAVAATKEGRACSQNILGLVVTGDSSIHTAKKNGGITQVSSVDRDQLQAMYFYAKSCTVVRGN